ncbi:MAG TPA: hypothetical protein VNX46_05355 [Candidatus Acidoferrum sp.]|nr:hypothetical protein [Candidatus Acidoferrum sp.]
MNLMAIRKVIWRVTHLFFQPLFWLASHLEKRAVQQSFSTPVVRCHQSDDFRYYENGRWVTVSGELMSGSTGIDRLIYRQSPLKWNDTGTLLTPGEAEKVFQKVGEHLDESKVRWKFSDASSGN